jgi:enolase
MPQISDITAREILNSKGNPTIEVTVTTDQGYQAVASCPSGTSTGTYEAFELKDKDPKRYMGGGMLKAIENVHNTIAPALKGMEVTDQAGIDQKMIQLDGSSNKMNLGANTILAVSMSVAKAGALASQMPLYQYLRQFINTENLELRVPTPLFNVLNGGAHAGGNIDMQEFIVTPGSYKGFSEGLHMGFLIYKHLGELLKKNGASTLIGDEGGYGPALRTNEEALQLLLKAIELTSLRIGYDVFCGIDAAGSSFFDGKKYKIMDKPTPLTGMELAEFYKELIGKYNIVYLEDPFGEDDFDSWTHLQATAAQGQIITGDDLTVTNPLRLQLALDKSAISGIIIKPNQIGTVSESIAVVEMARSNNIKVTVSHRSGETNDDFIADFAVGVSSDYVKFGAPARGERVAKYNRLLQIESEIASVQPALQQS